MQFTRRWYYYKRLFQTYIFKKGSNLSFWHETPILNENASIDHLGQYYMVFDDKANYDGPFDSKGIPLLDYQSNIMLQYNPVAISQYGLAHYNRYKEQSNYKSKTIFLNQALWLTENLERNASGVHVWNHWFNWEYKEVLKAPWYSALSQGQGISLLLRAWIETGSHIFKESADKAFESFLVPISKGGVTYHCNDDELWFEEYIIDSPTHILNGFIWALWGIYDYKLITEDSNANLLLYKALATLKNYLKYYDTGYWSLYDFSKTSGLKMLSSPFYHKLHIVQLRVIERLTNEAIFGEYASKWDEYSKNPLKKFRALILKILFKTFYY